MKRIYLSVVLVLFILFGNAFAVITFGGISKSGGNSDYVNVVGDTMTGNLTMGANSILMTGSLSTTGSRTSKGWFTDIESTNMPSVGATSIQTTFVDTAGDTMTGLLTLPTLTATGLSTLTSIDASSRMRFTTGVAVTAGSFEVCRDLDGSGQLHLNMPTGATLEVSVNDVAAMTVNATVLSTPNQFYFGKTAYTQEIDDGNSGSADTIDWTTGNNHKSTMTADCTYTFTAPPGPAHITLKMVQDGSGTWGPTWPATVKWEGGAQPTWSETAGDTNIAFFYFDGTSYWGSGLVDGS